MKLVKKEIPEGYRNMTRAEMVAHHPSVYPYLGMTLVEILANFDDANKKYLNDGEITLAEEVETIIYGDGGINMYYSDLSWYLFLFLEKRVREMSKDDLKQREDEVLSFRKANIKTVKK